MKNQIRLIFSFFLIFILIVDSIGFAGLRIDFPLFRYLPVILAGNGGGAFETGRHVDLGEEVPLSNLYVRMLNEFGVNKRDFGDSNGMLKKV